MTFYLVYYYPDKSSAPSAVGRSLFNAIIKKELNCKIGVFPQTKKNINELEKKNGNINIISINDFLNKKNCLVHFSVDPHVFPNKKFLIFLISLAKQHRIIINLHGEPQTEFKIMLKDHNIRCLFNLPNYFLISYLLKSVNAVVLNSYFMKKVFELKYGLNNINVIPNGLDTFWLDSKKGNTAIYSDIKAKFENNLIFFFHGRLAPEKGVDILLYAFNKTYKKYKWGSEKKSMMLYIAGDGPQKQFLETLSNKLGINNKVFFLGKIPRITLKSCLQLTDVAIYPSIYEPFSLAVLEAFSSVNGPVLYSNNTGIDGFVKRDGYNFITFEPTVSGISNAIECIIENKYNSRIHNMQKEFANEYKWDKIADEYIELYNRFL